MARILVAEDNPNARQLVHDILESIGYESILAVDGPSAVAAAQSQIPDLIILDVNMPGMSGFEVCKIIKADPKLSHIPVLMLTAQTDVESQVRRDLPLVVNIRRNGNFTEVARAVCIPRSHT